MTEIISVRFKSGGKQYYFDPAGFHVEEGQGVIVETGKGLEYGTCVRPNSMVEDESVVQPLRPVVRLATDKDLRQIAENKAKEGRTMKLAQQQIERHGLDMKLVGVEYSFDGSKIIFFFTSDGRVDFRALVKDLAGMFRARIELRQIGVRDEARMLGGLGICGRPFCCAQFLDEFQPVSIKMAKTQNLSLNPTKISGTCGRLMCCLKYEQDAYEDAVKRCPKQDSFVECPDGAGCICQVNLLKEQVKVRLEDSNEQPKCYRTSEIRVIRSGKGRRPEDYVAPPKEELEKLRYIPPEEERPASRLNGGRSLAEALEQYMGSSAAPAQEQPDEQKKSGRSRRHRGGKGGKRPEGQAPQTGEGRQSAREERPEQPRFARENKDGQQQRGGRRPQQGQQGQKDRQSRQEQRREDRRPPKAAQEERQPRREQSRSQNPAPEGESGENRKRRYRPHHRRPKKPGEGGAPTGGGE